MLPVAPAKELPSRGASGPQTDANIGGTFGAHISSPSPFATITPPTEMDSPPSTSRLQDALSCNNKRDFGSFMRDEILSPKGVIDRRSEEQLNFMDEPKAALTMPSEFWSLPHEAYLNSADIRVTSIVRTTTNTVNDSFDRLFVKRCKKFDIK